MDCAIFWPIRLVFVIGSLIASCVTLRTILRHRLNNRQPMRFILRIACCQLIMSLCVLAFGIWDMTGLRDVIDYDSSAQSYEFKDSSSAGFVMAQLEAVIFKSAELTSFCLISLFTVKLQHSIKDDDRSVVLVRWLKRASYVLPAILMGLTILFHLNGLCYVANQPYSDNCYFNNTCSSGHTQMKVGFYLVWLVPSITLFLISFAFIIRIELYLKRNIHLRDKFTNSQLLALTIHWLPTWCFVIYAVDIMLAAFMSDSDGAQAVLHNTMFLMPLPILWTVRKYKNYHVNYVLRGRDLDQIATKLIPESIMTASNGTD